MLTALTTVTAVGLLVAVIALRRRAADAQDEPRTWTRVLLGVALIAVSALAGQIADAATSDRPDLSGIGGLISSIGCVLACGPFYLGLINWNRARLEDMDPGDSVNGFSAILAMVALGNLVLPHFRTPHDWLDQWQDQTALWAVGGLFVVFGAGVSIAMMAGLRHDPRIWVMSAALGVALTAESVGLVTGPPGARRSPWSGFWPGWRSPSASCSRTSPPPPPTRTPPARPPSSGPWSCCWPG